VASLASVFRAIGSKLPTDVAADIESRLSVLKARYSRYRHKLFGHTAVDRRAIVDEYNAEKFTFGEQGADLVELEYVFKVLFEAYCGRSLPTFESAKKMIFPYKQHMERTEADTNALLTGL
jgi:hypothetical protein